MRNIVFILKNFIKDLNQDFLRFFPGKLEKNEKQNLSETQIYPKGINIIKVLNIDAKQRLDKIDFSENPNIASIGTCFAEELSIHLKKTSSFLNYINIEKNVFNFSANWGRVYTVKNLKQIIDYSFSDMAPLLTEKYKNKFFDPLREYSVGYFNSKNEAVNSIKIHRTNSKKIFNKTNLIVITLGQNEYWYDHKNNVAWGTTPAIIFRKQKNRFEAREHSFKQNVEDLKYIVLKLKKFNPKINIIFTVSPVATYATFISKNIVSQSFAGKCNLRTAIHEILPLHDKIFYYPSFEFVLSDNPSSFISDNRHVKRYKVSQILSSLNKSLLKK